MGSLGGIDLHPRRSVVVDLNDDGDRLSWSRIDNSPSNLVAEVHAARPAAQVAMDASGADIWAADVIAE